MLQKNKPFEDLQILATLPLESVLDEIECFSTGIAILNDESSFQNLPVAIENKDEKEEMICTFELMADIIASSATLDDITANIDTIYQKVMQVYEENISTIFEKTKPYEKTIQSLNLLYENAGGEANAYILPVNNSKFADSANPKHFNIMRDYLLKKWEAWQMENSPFYLTYIGDIGSKNAMDKMAEIALKTCALAILDIKEMGSVKAVINQAKRLKITGIPTKLGHLVIPATWVYANGVRDVKFVRDEEGKTNRIESKMAVPAACCLVGKLLSVKPGVYITGMEADSIIGIDGVKLDYRLERTESRELANVGLVQIESHGHIQGTTTANNSSIPELRKFPKVDTSNALLKDLVEYCNKKAFSKWGRKQQREFKKEIETYMNRRVKQDLIEGYAVNQITYDHDEENVDIDITVNFFEVADEFDIDLHGPRGVIDLKRES